MSLEQTPGIEISKEIDPRQTFSLDTFITLYQGSIFNKIGLPSISGLERKSVRHDTQKKMEIWSFNKTNTEAAILVLKNQLDRGEGISVGVRYGIFIPDTEILLATFYIPENTGAKTEIKIETKKIPVSKIYEIRPIVITMTALGIRRQISSIL